MKLAIGKIAVVSGLIIMALSGCASTPQEAPPPPRQSPVATPRPYERPPQTPSQSPAARPVPKAEYKPMANDTCGANGLQYLVGKPRTEIPVPLDPGSRRVICSTCVTTQEYRADRQTILFDSDTGLIKSVTCG